MYYPPPPTTDRNSLKITNLAYIEGTTDLYKSILVPVWCYGPSQWHLSRQHLSWLHLSISGISQLLLTWFWWNFKGRFLRLSWTDFNYRSDICPGNICPGDICPYQEYLSCYWPNFDKTLKVGSCDYLEQISTVAAMFVLKNFGYKNNCGQKKFCPRSFVKIRSVTAEIFLIWTTVAKKVSA